jgi:hypothetical protein
VTTVSPHSYRHCHGQLMLGGYGTHGTQPRRLQIRGHEGALYASSYRRIVSHRIASYRIVSHRIASYRIVSHRIASYRIVSHRIASYRIVSHRSASYRIVWCRIVSLRIASYRIVWCRTVLYRPAPHLPFRSCCSVPQRQIPTHIRPGRGPCNSGGVQRSGDSILDWLSSRRALEVIRNNWERRGSDLYRAIGKCCRAVGRMKDISLARRGVDSAERGVVSCTDTDIAIGACRPRCLPLFRH